MIPAIPPAIGLGAKLLTGASLVGTGAAFIPSIMQYGVDRRKALIEEGPDVHGDYNFLPGDRLAIEEETLPASRNKYLRKLTSEDGTVAGYQRMARRQGKDLPILDGMDKQKFLDTYDSDIQELSNTARRKSLAEDERFTYNSFGNREERRLTAEARNDNLLLLAQQRADKNESRLDELGYLRSRDNKEDLRYNERIERENKKDRRAAISSTVAGLVALGAAFAV